MRTPCVSMRRGMGRSERRSASLKNDGLGSPIPTNTPTSPPPAPEGMNAAPSACGARPELAEGWQDDGRVRSLAERRQASKVRSDRGDEAGTVGALDGVGRSDRGSRESAHALDVERSIAYGKRSDALDERARPGARSGEEDREGDAFG